MANSYTQDAEIKDRASRELAQLQNNMAAARSTFASIEAALVNMATNYGPWAAGVDAAAQANPGNTAWTVLKAQKDAIVAEFGTLTTEVVALKNAVAGV